MSVGQETYKEHLPGGELSAVDPTLLKANPKTSAFVESVLGQLNQLLRLKPNIITIAAESYIMFLNNQTVNWLNQNDEKERNSLIKKASFQVQKYEINYKCRLHEINKSKQVKIQEKVKLKEKQDRDRLRKQTEYTENIVLHGLWQSESEIDNILSYNSENEKAQGQIKFRKDVLFQVSDEKNQQFLILLNQLKVRNLGKICGLRS